MNHFPRACLRSRRALAAGILLSVCSGCSQPITGDWKTDNQSRGDPFYLTDARFNKDGTFNATARSTGLVIRLRGTYTQSWSKLTLKSSGRPDLIYSVRFKLAGREMELTSAGQLLIMKRQSDTPPDYGFKVYSPTAKKARKL